MKVIVGTSNPVKINAVRAAFGKVFTNKNIDVIGLDVSSGVSAQPLGKSETLRGAINRARNCLKKAKADFYVGIEGGVNKKMDTETAWIVVINSKGYLGKSSTSPFMLPHKITDELKKGRELSEAADKIFESKNSRQKEGAIGLLTHGVVDREKYYEQAVIIALIPFINKELYFEK